MSLTDSQESSKPARSSIPFYPLTIAAFPVLAVFSANVSLFRIEQLVRPILASVIVAAILQLLFTAVWRDLRRGSAAAGTAVIWAWLCSTVHPVVLKLVPGDYANVPYVVIGVVAVIAAGYRPIRPNFLNLASSLVVAVSIAQILWFEARPPVSSAAKSAKVEYSPLPSGPRPDIFAIFLDGFGSSASLKATMGLDLDWFVEELEERGFNVAENARSTYVQTQLSIPSTLNMDLIPNLIPDLDEESVDRRIIDPFIQEPAIARRLQASGYRYAAIGTGFGGIDFGRYTLPLPIAKGLTLFESTLLAMTPWSMRSFAYGSQFDERRRVLTHSFDRLDELARPTSTPRLIVSHILAPHPPFVLGPNGEPRRPRGPFGYFDASDYMQISGTPNDYKRGYSDQATFIAKRLLKTIDKLLSVPSEQRPIIVIQGDHGSKMGLDQNDLGKTDVSEAFSILFAAYAPPEVPLNIPEDIHSVNSFRLVLSALGAEDLPNLEGKSWYSPYAKPFQFEDVTQRLYSKQ